MLQEAVAAFALDLPRNFFDERVAAKRRNQHINPRIELAYRCLDTGRAVAIKAEPDRSLPQCVEFIGLAGAIRLGGTMSRRSRLSSSSDAGARASLTPRKRSVISKLRHGPCAVRCFRRFITHVS